MRLILLLALFLPPLPAAAATVSLCMAVAEDLRREAGPPVVLAAAGPGVPAAADGGVTITYAGHSTFVIETPAGVRIATDYSGAHGFDPLPRVVTMNKAHETHFTHAPDPGIEHVLPGWSPDGGPARHHLAVDDAIIRNVPTDIRMGDMMEADGNSIFIFEIAGLCIGHLGHLHHMLTDSHYAAIGRLDIVMVPVDGGLTLTHDGMSAIVKRLQSSIVLPMHRRFSTIESFLDRVGDGFDIVRSTEKAFTVSPRTLPRRRTILILAGI
ncbi:MAG: MBL fold metallo-hydrolase [Rhizobiaceae bacterium]